MPDLGDGAPTMPQFAPDTPENPESGSHEDSEKPEVEPEAEEPEKPEPEPEPEPAEPAQSEDEVAHPLLNDVLTTFGGTVVDEGDHYPWEEQS